MTALNKALAAIGSIGQPAVGSDMPDQSGVGNEQPAVQQLPGSSNFLQEILDRKRGRSEQQVQQPAATGDDAWQKRFDDMQSRYDGQIAELKNNHQQSMSLLERQVKAFENFARQPQQQAPVAPQQPAVSLPDYNVEDQEVQAALNTLEKRFDIRAQQFLAGVDGRIGNMMSTVANREFEGAIEHIKSKYSDWNKHFDEEAVRRDAAKLLSNPQNFQINWRRELELAYDARTAPTVRQELEELRKYKAENEKKVEREQAKQKQNLAAVPSIGGRGGTQQGGGLIADQILADAKRAGKRTLDIKSFGREFARRRGIG